MSSIGVLLPIFSLPGKQAIGCMDQSAYEFVDYLVANKQEYWQILPLSPVGYGYSPYQSNASFAGNPLLIDLLSLTGSDTLQSLQAEYVEKNGDHPRDRVDYSLALEYSPKILWQYFSEYNFSEDEEFQNFCLTQRSWLDEYAIYASLKDDFAQKPWYEWPQEYRYHKSDAIDDYRMSQHDQIIFHKFVQYIFFKQWHSLKSYANDKGLKIIGDIPIYVSHDSVDVWSNPDLFELDEKLEPLAVAGCPPDYFSEDGQLWGNPLYNWDYHQRTQYRWWKQRLQQALSLYDILRIDHFRGFASYYAISYPATNAREGQWLEGPGMHLFAALKLPQESIIAEDLGLLTEDVFELLEATGFAGMKVLQFAFNIEDKAYENGYLPRNYTANCIAYTGTHDNDTLFGYLQNIDDATREFICKYYKFPATISDELLAEAMLQSILNSEARIKIIPMQDYLQLGSFARINTPSTLGINWLWRMTTIS